MVLPAVPSGGSARRGRQRRPSLRAERLSAGPASRISFCLGLLISFAPLLGNQFWDLVAGVLQSQEVPPPTVAAAIASDDPEARAYAACCNAAFAA